MQQEVKPQDKVRTEHQASSNRGTGARTFLRIPARAPEAVRNTPNFSWANPHLFQGGLEFGHFVRQIQQRNGWLHRVAGHLFHAGLDSPPGNR